LRLLDGVTETTSSAAQDDLGVPAMIAASARTLHLGAIAVTACASLVNDPG
jgi:hypothetical protein